MGSLVTPLLSRYMHLYAIILASSSEPRFWPGEPEPSSEAVFNHVASDRKPHYTAYSSTSYLRRHCSLFAGPDHRGIYTYAKTIKRTEDRRYLCGRGEEEYCAYQAFDGGRQNPGDFSHCFRLGICQKSMAEDSA